MSLPPFLLAEVRSTFRLCAQQHAVTRRCPFTTSSIALRKRTKPDSSTIKSGRSSSESALPSSRPAVKDAASTPRPEHRDMIPHEEGGKAVGKERKTEVPMKVIPQAQISPKHKLSPMQRLHIEHLTRHPPKQQTSKVYKERLLIYHYGIGRVNWMVFIRVSAIIAVCFMTVIWAPAYFNYGTPWYYVGAVYLASFIPITFIGWATRSIATEIWLRLPVVARQSPQAAMAYAKNLPRGAIIELRFMRWTGHTGTIPVNVVDTTPVTSRWRIKPASFKWIGPRVDAGTALRPNPTQFFIRPTSAEGRAVRDTIPGLWSAVYKRLTGVDSSAVSKWKS